MVIPPARLSKSAGTSIESYYTSFAVQLCQGPQGHCTSHSVPVQIDSMAAEGVNRAVALESFDPENPTSTLKIIERPIPEPASGEVLVRISLRPVRL